MCKRLPALFIALLMLMPLPSQALDFDGDGIDDPTAYENQHDGSANELAYTFLKSSTGGSVRYEFGKAKEFPALADYDGDGVTDFAAVGPEYESNPSGDLKWRIRNSSQDGDESSIIFGAVGDSYIAGCSFDDDALADLAYIRQGVLHVLKSSDSTEATLDLVEQGLNRFTCGDIDGDGGDDLIAQGSLRRNGGAAKSYFLAWNLRSSERILDVEFGSDVKSIHAFDIDGDGVKEIAYRKDKDGYGRKLVVRLNETAVVLSLPRFEGVAFGRFIPDSPIEGLVLKIPKDDQFIVIPNAAALSARTQIELFDTVSAIPSINTAEVGPAFSTELGCDVQDEPNDGPNGFLWKPVSHTQQNVVILTTRALNYRNMRIVKGGVTLEEVRRVTKGPGNRDFFRSRKLAKTFPNYLTLKMNSPDGLTHCILIPDPNARYD